jgi:hypothetical protein
MGVDAGRWSVKLDVRDGHVVRAVAEAQGAKVVIDGRALRPTVGVSEIST